MSHPQVPGSKWDRKRAERFAQDWNEGMRGEVLREKYGVKNTTATAHQIRQTFGLELRRRGPNGRLQ